MNKPHRFLGRRLLFIYPATRFTKYKEIEGFVIEYVPLSTVLSKTMAHTKKSQYTEDNRPPEYRVGTFTIKLDSGKTVKVPETIHHRVTTW